MKLTVEEKEFLRQAFASLAEDIQCNPQEAREKILTAASSQQCYDYVRKYLNENGMRILGPKLGKKI